MACTRAERKEPGGRRPPRKMGGFAKAACGLVAAAVLAGCGVKKETLYVYTWSDYVDQGVVEAFEKENSCRVIIDTFDTNESMYAKLRAGGVGYDLIFPSTYYLQMLADAKLIQPFNLDLLPSVRKNFDPQFRDKAFDPSLTWAVPYTVVYTCMAVNGKRFPALEPTWNLYLDERFAGRATLIDDMRMTIGAALKALGYSLNSVRPEEIEAAKGLVIKWKRNIARFENEAYKTGLASSEFFLCMAYSGDIAQVQEETPDIKFIYPKEGFPCSCDEMCIPADARHVGLAHKFVDFLYKPEWAARNIAYIGFLSPVKPAYALLPAKYRDSPVYFPPPEDLKRAESLRYIGKSLELYIHAWDEIRAAE